MKNKNRERVAGEDDGPIDTPSQQGSAGGNISRRVGKRAEEKHAEGQFGIERVTGSDDPAADRKKGEATLGKIRESRRS